MAAPRAAPGPHPGPWTEEEFLALPEDRYVELLDGSLLVSPAGRGMHQWLSSQIWAVLNAAAPSGLRALESVNLRVAPGTICIPDVVVLVEPDMRELYFSASAARLVVEITSPGNAYVDRALKPQLYAQAGIAQYLRIDLRSGEPAGHLHVLRGYRYGDAVHHPPGEPVELAEPFPVTLDLARLAVS